MSPTIQILVAVIIIIQTWTGVTLNTCILSFFFESIQKRSIVNPIHVIYFAMALVNVFLQLVYTAYNLIFSFWNTLLSIREIQITFHFLTLGPVYYTYWLTGWLCVYYCITINNFTHQLIVGFKRILSSYLPQILLLTTIVPLIISGLFLWVAQVMWVVQTSTNSTLGILADTAIEMPIGFSLMATFLGSSLPLLLAVISTVVTTSSLIKHIKNMKQNISARPCPNLQVLISVVRTMVLFLTLCVIYYMLELFCIWRCTLSGSDVITIVTRIVVSSFLSVEAVIIIQGSPTLRKMILKKICARFSDNV